MLMVQLFGMVDGKRVCYVVMPVLAGQQRLLGCVSNAGQMACIHRDAGHIAQSACDIFRLVVSATPQTVLMQRNGDDNVDSIEEIRVLHLHGCLSSELVTDHRLVCIFHRMDGASYRLLFLEEKERSSAHQMHRFADGHHRSAATGQCRLCLVLAYLRLFGAGQTRETSGAKKPFFPDVPSAYGAALREEETIE